MDPISLWFYRTDPIPSLDPFPIAELQAVILSDPPNSNCPLSFISLCNVVGSDNFTLLFATTTKDNRERATAFAEKRGVCIYKSNYIIPNEIISFPESAFSALPPNSDLHFSRSLPCFFESIWGCSRGDRVLEEAWRGSL